MTGELNHRGCVAKQVPIRGRSMEASREQTPPYSGESASDGVAVSVWRRGPRRVAVATVGGVAIVLVAILLADPTMGGDDPWVRAIADGSYTGHPSERLIFMNSMLGWLLRGLYSVVPGFGWYAALLYASLALATGVVIWLVLPRPMAVWVATLALFLYFASRTFMILSWTETGLFVAGTGVLLALCGPETRRAAGFAGALIALGFLVRPESLGVLVATAPLLWIARERWRHLLVAGLMAVAIVGPGAVYDRLHYTTDQDWREWFEFEQTRRNLHGTPKVDLDDSMDMTLRAIGWSKNDLQVFRAWYYADEKVFSTESIRALYHQRQHARGDFRFFEIVGRHTAGLAVICLAILLAGVRRWRAVLGSAGWAFALFTVMEVMYRSRTRVEIVLLFALAVGLALLLRDRPSPPIQPLLLIALTALVLPGLVQMRSANSAARENLATNLQALHDYDRDGTYVVVAGALPFHGQNPFHAGRLPVDLAMMGWTVRSPHFDAHLDRIGINDIYLDPIRRQDVYLVGEPTKVASVLEFVRERRNVASLVEPVAKLAEGVTLWKVEERSS